MSEVYTPNITVFDSAAEVEARIADLLIEQINQKPDSVLTLPTGGTPIGMYGLLVAAYRAKQVDFSQVTTINLDEYWPIKKSHPSSYDYYMNENLFNHVNIPEKNQNIPDGEAPDHTVEAERYKRVIQQHAIDLGLITLGPGKTCHIGFNEQGSELSSRVRYVPLNAETKEANLRFFDDPADMPVGAITQGVADILEAKRILFVATGEHKAWGVQRSLFGSINTEAPASFLRLHPNVSVFLDRAAASQLQ
jgi:glucosamine-6-phosphate deaminase